MSEFKDAVRRLVEFVDSGEKHGAKDFQAVRDEVVALLDNEKPAPLKAVEAEKEPAPKKKRTAKTTIAVVPAPEVAAEDAPAPEADPAPEPDAAA